MREDARRISDKLDKVYREREEQEDERKILMNTIVSLEQAHGEGKRDLELKEIKIESLESII